METGERSTSPGEIKKTLSWRAHEYVHVEKTPDWYWALGLIAVAAFVAALLLNNILFAVLILLIALVLGLFAARKPNVVQFSITPRGVRIDNTLYTYQNIKSFAIEELSPDHIPKLIIAPQGIVAPVLVIPIVDVDPDEVHDLLRMFLPEAEHNEPLSHRVMEWLGF